MATQNYFKVKNGLEFPSIETLQTTDNTGPSIKPSLNLDFAKTKALDSRITFTRASTATYYDGETTVKAEENLTPYSQDFDTDYWVKGTKVTISANSTTAPDGTLTADTFVETTTTSIRNVAGALLPFVSGNVYTFSVYAKNIPGGRGLIQIGAFGIFNGNAYANFDISSGFVVKAVNATASIVDAGNGWYRCVLTTTCTSSTTERINIALIGSATDVAFTTTYAGDATKGIYVWGAQVEQRDRATAYTPTTSSPITNYIPVLQTAATNAARFDHDPVTGESKGLLIEEARTNLLLASQDFESDNFGTWRKQSGPGTTVGVSAKATIAPDGTLTAQKLFVASGTSGYFNVYQGVAWSASTTYTLSVYAKSSDHNQIALSMVTSAGNAIVFNTDTGQVVSQYNSDAGFVYVRNGYVDVGNGWKRFFVTFTMPAGVPYGQVKIEVGNATNIAGKGIYIWGAQLEVGSFATSYIPTALTYTGRGSTATYRSTDGTIRTAQPNVARYEPNAAGGSNLLLENDATNLLTYTEYLDNSVVTKTRCNVAANSSMSPDGLMNSDKIIEDTSASLSHYIDIANLSVTANQTLTYSVYAKAENRSIFVLGLRSNDLVSSVYAEFNLTAVTSSNRGVAGSGSYTTSSITPVGGGWYRCSVTGIIDSSSTSARVQLYLEKTTGSFYYTGDGVSGLYIWGAQLESGSVATSYIPSTETHTGRSSTATYYDSTGTIRTAASGQPRYTYNPSNLNAAPKLLLEAAATNLLTYSQSFSNWTRSNTTISVGGGASTVFGFATDRITLSANTGEHQTGLSVGGLTNGSTYTASVYVRPNSLIKGFQLYVPNSTAADVDFNLSTLTCGAAGTIAVLSDGWYRLSASFPVNNTSSTFYVFAARTPGTYNFTADGTEYFDICGAQFELGYTATSYIPTTSTQVTRAADTSTSAAGSRAADVYSSSQVTRSAEVARMTGTNFSSWYRADEGTLYATGTVGVSTNYGPFFTTQVSGGSTRIQLTAGNAAIISNGSASADMYASTTPNVLTSVSTAYKTNDYAFAKDGVLVSQDSSGQVPQNLAYSTIGKFDFGGAQSINGTVKRIAYYPKRLTNAELVSITS